MPISLRGEVGGRAAIETRIATKVGIEVNIGERFTIGLKVRNVASPGDNVVFTRLTVQMLQTPYAAPIDRAGARVPFVEQVWAGSLGASQSQEFLQDFEALASASGTFFSPDPNEFIAYKVFLTVDPVRLLEEIRRDGTATFQIGARHYFCTNPDGAHEHAYWQSYCMQPIPTDGGGTRLCGYPIPQ